MAMKTASLAALALTVVDARGGHGSGETATSVTVQNASCDIAHSHLHPRRCAPSPPPSPSRPPTCSARRAAPLSFSSRPNPLNASLSLTRTLTTSLAGPYLVNPCTTNATFKSAKFCDFTLGINERAADIVSRLSIPEKIDALGTGTGPLPSVGLPAYNWWSEATHGISHVRDGPGSSTPEETNFALPITTAGSFNRTVWSATGHAIGVEARAFMNAGNAYSTYWAPVINRTQHATRRCVATSTKVSDRIAC